MTDSNATQLQMGMRARARGANPSLNWASLAFSIARVKEVLYEELKVTLVVLTGEQDVYEYPGVDLTLPGGGKRHILGAMPERGDFCYVGWAARESAGTASARTPVIIGWLPPAPWMGHEWIAHSPMAWGEGLDTARDRTVAAGTFERIRHKMRHAAPGNVFASSSQGSDLVLDEGVFLSNRRANELRLRDEDQALVVRTVAQFHAMAGARVYAGPVQREARLLPTAMFSDGIYWDAPRQVDPAGRPLTPDALGTDARYPRDFLTPGLIFRRSRGDRRSAFEEARGITLSPRVDPFDFLRWGAYVDASGSRLHAPTPEAVYGGKALYRVGFSPTATGTPDNAAGSAHRGADSPPPDSLSEYRIEVTHTHPGTLPVTEQTDGFDAERLPSEEPDSGNPLARSSSMPFVEWVMGSVVGNDPFSASGRPLYGIPLRAQVFTGSGELAPGLLSAMGVPVKDQAASLFRVTSPVPNPDGSTVSSFTSFTKDGRFKAYLGGGPITAEVGLAGDLALSVGGTLDLDLRGGISLHGHPGPGNLGLRLGSATGAVHISGGGSLDTGSGANERAGAVTGATAPSVLVEGAGNVTVRSGGSIHMEAPSIRLTQAASAAIHAQTHLSLQSGGRLSVTAQNLDQIVSGAERTNYGGPSGGDPTSGPSRQVTFSATPATGSAGGVTDKYQMVFGDRLEEFTLRGSHTTRMVAVGDLTYETNQGTWTCRAGTNRIEASSTSGVATVVGVGDATTTVAAGAWSATGQTGVRMDSPGGAARVQGTGGVTLAAPPMGPPVSGGIMCGSDVDPLTGLPFSTFLVPRGQVLGSPS